MNSAARDGELIARESELDALGQLLQRAASGRGSFVLVSGDAGIGKSALARRAARDAEALGAEIVLGRAWELGEAPAYFPLRACFAALGLNGDDLAGDYSAFRTWERVLEALAKHCEARLVVWILEDLHAADLGSLDLLALLAQPLTALRALVIATSRLKDPRVDERVAQRLTRMARDGHELRLEPLPPEAVRKLAERTIGRALTAGTAAQLAERCAGNPLFVVESARALGVSGAAAGSTLLPPTVRQVVWERVRLLPESTREALAAAAVLGREVSAAHVAAMLDKLPAQIISALEPARRVGLIDELRPAQFMFSHILVRDAIEDGVEAANKAELHARASRVLSTLGDDPELLVERARHALAALVVGDEAIELGLRAAELLERQGAFDRAHAMYQRVEDARRSGSGPPATPLQRVHEARVAVAAGRFTEARKTCLELAERARQDRDPELLAHAALALGAELRPAVVDPELVGLLEEARGKSSELGAALSARVLARLAAALQPAPDPQIPAAMAREAIALARAVGDDATLVEVLLLAGAALVDFTPFGERIDMNLELAQLALARGDIGSAARAYVRLAMVQIESGDFNAWDDSVNRALELAERGGQARHRFRALLLDSMRALARGDTKASDRAVYEVQQLQAVSDDPALSLSLFAHEGSRARLLHRDADMHRNIRELEKMPSELVSGTLIVICLRAAHFTRLEQLEATRNELARLRGRAPLTEDSYFNALLAEAYAFVGDREQCRRLRALLAEVPGPELVGGHVPMTYDGPLGRTLGLLDSALGDHAGAERGLRGALERVAQQGFSSWIAQIHYDLARALLRAGAVTAAEAELERALEVALNVDMPGLVERARSCLQQLAAAAPASAAPPTRASSKPPSEPPRARFRLTRSGDVWRIDYDGRVFNVKDSRGLQLLSRLVERSGEELHVLALASDESGATLAEGSAGDLLDERAKRQYQKRLSDLQTEIADAERDNDRARLSALSREKSLLEAEIARAFGLGNRARGASSPSERARVNVQRRLKDAISRIAEHDPVCARFLERAVRTGNYCCFLG